MERPRPVAPGPVRRRPCHALADGGVIGKDVVRKTEIENHDAAPRVDQDVGRLDVPMKLASVATHQSLDELPEDVPDPLRAERRRRRRFTNASPTRLMPCTSSIVKKQSAPSTTSSYSDTRFGCATSARLRNSRLSR